MGFLAASIAVGGFLLQALPTLNRRSDQEVRAAAVTGGLVGFFFAGLVMVVVSW
jgi:hypothetical protein